MVVVVVALLVAGAVDAGVELGAVAGVEFVEVAGALFVAGADAELLLELVSAAADFLERRDFFVLEVSVVPAALPDAAVELFAGADPAAAVESVEVSPFFLRDFLPPVLLVSVDPAAVVL